MHDDFLIGNINFSTIIMMENTLNVRRRQEAQT